VIGAGIGSSPVVSFAGSYPQTGFGEISGDVLEADFWPASLRAGLRGRQTFGHINVVVGVDGHLMIVRKE